MKHRLLISTIMAVSLSACASTNIEQRSAGLQITDAASVEASYAMESQKLEDKIAKSGARITDPALNSYLENLTGSLIGDYKGEVRVYAVEAPVFNAGILPNGAMVINSGLLLRAESEAELALVLGHEFGHYVENHAVERRNAAKNATVANAAFSVGTLGYGGILSSLVAISSLASFSREQETEADDIGLTRTGDAGYDTSQAVMLWKNLHTEKAASTNKKVRKRNSRGSAIFDTHPTSKDRLDSLTAQAKNWSGTITKKDEYRAVIRPHLQNWLEAELTQRDYGAILVLIDRLSERGQDQGVLEYTRGRLFTLRKEEGDKSKAQAAYEIATTHSDVPVVVWRDLGDLYARQGENAKAVTAFNTYLSRSPNAQDAALIQNMLTTLRN